VCVGGPPTPRGRAVRAFQNEGRETLSGLKKKWAETPAASLSQLRARPRQAPVRRRLVSVPTQVRSSRALRVQERAGRAAARPDERRRRHAGSKRVRPTTRNALRPPSHTPPHPAPSQRRARRTSAPAACWAGGGLKARHGTPPNAKHSTPAANEGEFVAKKTRVFFAARPRALAPGRPRPASAHEALIARATSGHGTVDAEAGLAAGERTGGHPLLSRQPLSSRRHTHRTLPPHSPHRRHLSTPSRLVRRLDHLRAAGWTRR